MGSAINRNARLMGIVGEVCREAARSRITWVAASPSSSMKSPSSSNSPASHLAITWESMRSMPESHDLHVDVAPMRFELAIFECLRVVFGNVHIQRIAVDIVAAARQRRQVVLARPFNCTAHAFMADSRQIGAFDISENHGMSFLVANPKTTHHRAAHPL